MTAGGWPCGNGNGVVMAAGVGGNVGVAVIEAYGISYHPRSYVFMQLNRLVPAYQ